MTDTPIDSGLRLDNSYARLPDRFFTRQGAARAPAPRLLRLNHALAAELGLDVARLSPRDLADLFSGNRLPLGAEPLAQAYAGHQFGGFVPQLGDGRALLLGEVIDTQGTRRDIQLKGSGRTPYSRGGDGRAALGPVLREYLVSEAMAALGIPTTRALAAVSTGAEVFRDTALPGAVLTRVAASHVRVGTFQYFAARRDEDAIALLIQHVIGRHYPHLAGSDTPALDLIRAVAGAQAALVARWMGVGFVHGVMNTDNTAISGETIDYGPCAFVDTYSPGAVFSAIDHQGRYAYARQPGIAQWNLARLAECLLGQISSDDARAVDLATEALAEFGTAFGTAWTGVLATKLGLSAPQPADRSLGEGFLDLLAGAEDGKGADFTLSFQALGAMATGAAPPTGAPDLAAIPGFDDWAPGWRARLAQDGATPAQRAEILRGANPVVIARNHLVEQALSAAHAGDMDPFDQLLQAVLAPQDMPADTRLTLPPQPQERVLNTFCGT